MKITPSNNHTSFGRLLKPEEMSDYQATLKKGKEKAGQTGMSIFIAHDACLPQTESVNTGVANLAMDDSKEFLKFINSYLGLNITQVLPQGHLNPASKRFVAYGASGLSLGNHQINPKLLTDDRFHSILKPEEFQEIVNANMLENKDAVVNFENVAPDNSTQDRALRKAYARFKDISNDTQIKKDYESYVKENSDWLEPKGIYAALTKENGNDYYKNWTNKIDRELYNPDFDDIARKSRIEELKKTHPDEFDFLKFKQYIADEHLKIGRKNVNDSGMKLIGDCLIGFSKDEVWANPKAFKKDHYIALPEWGLPALDYETINDENSAAARILKRKVELCAKRYDSIRFDVAWAYTKPIVTPKGETKILAKNKLDLGSSVLEMIERTVKKVKGEDFDLKNLIHEFEAGPDDFAAFENNKLIEAMQGRTKIYGSTFMEGNEYYPGWGSNDAFLRLGWHPDEFIIGPGNHDPQPLRQIANNIVDTSATNTDGQYHKAKQIEPLSVIFKRDTESLEDPIEFAKAKFAEPMMAKNNQYFYMDIFGKAERFDEHLNGNYMDYRYKIPANYKQAYIEAVKEGYGFNPMDALEKVFKTKGLDKTESELYEKIIKYRDILLDNETVQTIAKKSPIGKYLIAGGVVAATVIGAGIFLLNKNKKAPVQAAVQHNTNALNDFIKKTSA